MVKARELEPNEWIESIFCSSTIHPSLACWFIQSGFLSFSTCFHLSQNDRQFKYILLISWKIFKYSEAFFQHGFVGFLGERERERDGC